MSIYEGLALGALTCCLLLPLRAEHHCPGNVPSVPLTLAPGTQIVVPVLVNHRGPFKFLVDTGAQVTILDTKLGGELNLQIEGTTGVIGVGSRASAAWSHLDTLQTGIHSAENTLVLVQDLGHLSALDPHIRGILGGNFLSRFDLLIDYEHTMLCLDTSGALGTSLRGTRTRIVAIPHAKEEAVLSVPLVVRASSSGRNKRDYLLLLDSGTNAAVLYNETAISSFEVTSSAGSKARGIDGTQHVFSFLPSDNLLIDGTSIRDLSFMTASKVSASVPRVAFDGLLPTAVFKSIYINYTGRYVMLNPRR